MLIPFLLIVLSFFVYKIRKRQMTLFERLGIPGPKPNLIFGNSIDIAKQGTSKVFPKWTNNYGPIVGFYIGGLPQVLISDFELIRLVLVKDFHLFTNRNEIVPGGLFPQLQLKNGIILKKGNSWKQLRSTLSPSFSITKLNGMEDLLMTSIEDMMKQIDHESKCGRELNFQPHAQELTFTSSTNCFMGVKLSVHQFSNEIESLINSVKPRLEKSMLAMAMLLFPSLTFFAYPLRVLWETIRLKMMWSDDGVVVDLVKKIVRARKVAKTKPNDVLQLLLDCVPSSTSTDEMPSSSSSSLIFGKTKQRLSEDTVIANSFIFLLAGFETTSTTLQFIISDLVNNQDVQDELRNEIKKQVDLNGGVANLQVFNRVPLLLYTIKESLRMHPPLSPFTSRIGEEDYEHKEMRIPKGTGIFIGVSSIHNDPQLWSEPEKYKPERFAEEYNKLAFLPFGAGPRNCIGMQFAYMELQLALANLILRYRFETSASTEKEIQTIETSATMIPKNGVYCKVVKIEE